MEHLVGIKVKDKVLGEIGFVTWGRIFDPVDDDELLAAVKKNLKKFGIFEPESMEVCYSLQDVSEFLYFYEAIFEFSKNKFPDTGAEYKKWRAKKKKAILQGEDIYSLGLTKTQKRNAKNLEGTISHGFAYL